MRLSKNYIFYSIPILIFILMKTGFMYSTNDDLVFLLKPTNKIIEFITGATAVYLPEIGYYHERFNISIEKSCAGFNYWILSFTIFSIVFIQYFNKYYLKIAILPLLLLGTYIFTVFVNSSRIFSSIIIQKQLTTLSLHEHHIVHEAIGVIINLSFLIISYFIIDKLLNRPI